MRACKDTKKYMHAYMCVSRKRDICGLKQNFLAITLIALVISHLHNIQEVVSSFPFLVCCVNQRTQETSNT